MELKNVDIKNFKSLESVNLNVQKDCKILVGVSESGKTNFLTALRVLDSSYVVNNTFVKEGTRKKDDAYVDFELSLNSDEKKIVIDELLSKNENLNNIIINKNSNKNIKLENFIDTRIIYRVDIRNNNRKYIYYKFDNDDYSLNPSYAYIDASNEKAVIIKNSTSNTNETINRFMIILKNDYDCDYDYKNDIEIFFELLEKEIVNIINQKKLDVPKVLFWEYKEEYLLPAEVTTIDFINNPDMCIPLKNMFELCEIHDIKSEYEDKKAMGESAFQNLLNDVSKDVDTYLKKKWKSMPKDAKITLQEVGSKINIRIQDSKYTYSISKRSDGFKRMVTFLLMLSIDNKNSSLSNTLILIDEPDVKIDIPGQEYLRDELINIGKNNYVIYSTHSTNMIDNNYIERHIIIKKENESSKIEEANEDNYTNVATLYKALGMNVYSVINANNIVFEGWSDQLVFKLYIGKNDKYFKNVGVTHLSGITKITTYAEFWGLLSKKYFIISDADETALQMKDTFTENNFDGKWLTYDELLKNKITLEDFITNDRILKVAKKFKDENDFSTELIEENLNVNSNKMSIIENWIRLNVGNKQTKNIVKKFKKELYNNIKKADITNDYKEFIKNLTTIIKGQ